MNERINDIQARRAVILIEIDLLKSETTNLSNISDQIHQLEQDYNTLVDEEEELTPSPFSDPLRVFPPELWTSLIPDDVDEILNLAMVSSHWSQALLSLPALWTTVVLDSREEDYLAKAMTCIHLSQPMEITLRIKVASKVWREIAPLILGEGNPVTSLSMGMSIWQEFVTPLGALRSFPSLKHLEPPTGYQAYYDQQSGKFLPNTYSWNQVDASNLQFFPLILDASGFAITLETLKHPNLTSIEGIWVRRLDQEMATTLASLDSLKHFHLDEQEPQPALSMEPTGPILLSVVCFQYYGWNVPRTLQYIGNSLVKLQATVDIHEVPMLLGRLARFTVLRELSLRVGQASRTIVARDTADTVEIHSIKYLALYFKGRELQRSPDEVVAQTLRDDLAGRAELFTSVFDSLALTIRLVEDARLHGEFMTIPALRYIQTLRNLKSLSLLPRAPDTTGLNLEAQELVFSWYELPALFMDRFQCSYLLNLTMGNMDPMESPQINMEFECYFARDALFLSWIPSVLALHLCMAGPVPWNLSTFRNIISIDFDALPGDTSASDFFEELTLRPMHCPCLERIGLRGDFMEWDILIMMLERRNFDTKGSFKHIKTLELDVSLPYCGAPGTRFSRVPVFWP